MAKWQKIDTAPRDGTEILAKIPGYFGGIYTIAWLPGFVDADGNECSCWVMEDSLDVPPSWTDGVCWARNEDGEPSVQPTHWRPIK